MLTDSTTFSEYNLKDYILDDNNIQKSLQFKLIKKDRLEENVQKNEKLIKKDRLEEKNTNFFIPIEKDTLFWCYFIIINGDTKYETLHTKNDLVVKQMKIELVSTIRKKKDLLKIYKFDTITNIESNLANDQYLNIKTFMALSAIANLNIIFVSKNTFFESFMNDTPVVYIVKEESQSKYNKKYGFELATEESISNIRKTLYKLDKIDKPIKAMSGYKSEELVNICTKLAIETINKETGKVKSKKDLYEAIIQYF